MRKFFNYLFPQRCQWCNTSRNAPAFNCVSRTVVVCGSSTFDPHRWPDGTGGTLPASPMTLAEFMADDND